MSDPSLPAADWRLLRERLCQRCPLRSGCPGTSRLEAPEAGCPHGVWFPANQPALTTPITRRHLAMFLLPVGGSGIWRRNVQELARRRNLFNGRKTLTVARCRGAVRNRATGAPLPPADPPEEVLEECRRNGLEWDEVLIVENDPSVQEGRTFLEMLDRTASTSPEEAVFYCHGKGVTHPPGSLAERWMQTMYEVCLDDWESVARALERHALAGPFRRLGNHFQTAQGHRWHYSGSFYWLRSARVFGRDWRRIHQTWHAAESWPDLVFPASEGACLFLDDAGNLYKRWYWRKVVEPALQRWREARA